MANIRHPFVIVGIIAVLSHVVAIALYTNRSNQAAGILMVAGFVLMAICWIWAIILVAGTDTLQGSQKKFWLIAVIAIPFIGGMFYHLMHSKRNTIVD
jgi:hypothetical protein